MSLTIQTTSMRISLSNILFATDFSAAARAALPYALAFTRHFGGTLHAVHVIPEMDILIHPEISSPRCESTFDPESQAALQRMQNLIPELGDGPHQAYVCRGKIWDVVSDILSREQIDLLVLGTHGRTGVGKLLLGSVAEELLRQAQCPVLTVGPRASGRVIEEFNPTTKDIRPADLELKQIICAVDFDPESLSAVPFAISLAEEFQARLGLLHVIDEHQATPTKLVLHRLENLIPEDATLWCTPETIVRFGRPGEKILQVASELNADLIVLGVKVAKTHLTSASHFPWSTVHAVIASASCPVLTVRT
jgi:nucleotide-binding universal stress UspA family protein